MCGIAGIAGRIGTEGELGRMLDASPWRGPDDRGTFHDGDVALSHLRLSIIDCTEAGHQPMSSHDGRYVIVFNGEIFNYIELRDELRGLGHTFQTTGDTEVILEAYRAWGESCVEKMNGMWAFALYDTREKTLFCARDRFGVKPFFYRIRGNELQFGSEMKNILALGKAEPDLQYLYHFFDRKTPLGCDRTVFRGIHHLRPGHTLTWKSGRISIRRFWVYDPDAAERTYDYNDPAKTFREIFFDSVKLRLRSDVPVGICLSGGIDSSAIAVVVKELGVRPHTFSSIYDEPAYSERQYIDAVNAAVGAESHTLTPRAEDFFAVMEHIVAHHDEPVRMPGVYSHWHVMQCAAPHVTVLLDGQGADEVVGGYDEYFVSYLASLLRNVAMLRGPGEALRMVRSTLDALPNEKGLSSRRIVREAIVRAIPGIRSLGGSTEKDRLFSQRFIADHARPMADDPAEVAVLKNARTLLDEEMYKSFRETNLPMLLRYEDRNSMAFSLEARTPFLDYRIVEFASALPLEWRIRGATTKVVVREALKSLLPEIVLHRKDKKGFPTPTSQWFKGPLAAQLRTRLLDGALSDGRIVSMSAVRSMIDEHVSGTRSHERPLFRLLTLETWLRRYA